MTGVVGLVGLEARGLVVRSRDPDDRRRHRLTITGGGKEVLDWCQATIARVTDDVFVDLSAEERCTLHRLTLRALGQPAAVADLHLGTPIRGAAASR